MIELTNSGERILLDKETPLMIARHLCAYKFVADYVSNKAVLDIGCGEGYGSFYLAGFAQEVTGIDYDKAIIDYAQIKYIKNNLTFSLLDIGNLDSLKDKFDVICAFQFIEHIQDVTSFVEKVKDLMKDNGIFVCSTPNKLDASPNSNVPLNKFHVREYLSTEFKELLETHFGSLDIWGLKRGRRINLYRRLKKSGLFRCLPAVINPINRFYQRINCDHFVMVKDKVEKALDFLAVCRIPK
jgi:SAM-dependent methyltransferase